jgi:autotransporter-associated beta strand protein
MFSPTDPDVFRKSRAKRSSCLLVAVGLAIALLVPIEAPAAYTATVDASTTYQTMEGWGTSLCWWANVVGGFADPARDNYITAFFDPVNGIGLNVVRYNIGGGENPIYNYLGYRDKIPGFEPSQGVYNWTQDANQRWILQQAIAKGANVVEAFSNSPPYWMTVSGSVTGGTSGGDNLQTQYFPAFADYLTTVVQHYRDNWGITFNTLEALNEPSSSWWVFGGGQEGCHFDEGEQDSIINDIGASLATKGLNGTVVSAPDDNQTNQSVGSIGGFDSIALGYIGQINTHDYTGNEQVQLNAQAQAYGKDLHMSEFGDNDGTGLTMSYHILNDLRTMPLCTAFVYWQAVDNATGWGFWLNGLSNETTTTYTVNEKYYVMGNYSKFIRPGYTLISINDTDSLAAVSPDGQTFVFVTTCGSTATSVTYALTNLGARTFTVTPYQTSSSQSLAKLSTFNVSGTSSFTSALPANSVTTFVLASQSPPPAALTWTGGTFTTGTNLWNTTASNTPWATASGSSSSFASGDPLTFDDSTANSNVSISGTVLAGLMTFNNSVNNYTFTPVSGGGSIGSYTTSTAIEKLGSGSLTINGSNNYAGATVINAGTVLANNAYALGTGQVDLNSATLTLGAGVAIGNNINVTGDSVFNTGAVTNTYSGTLSGTGAVLTLTGSYLTLTGGMSGYSGLLSTGSSSVQIRLNGNVGSATADFDLGSGSAFIYPRNGNITVSLGSLSGGVGTSLGGPSSDSNPVTYAIGGDNNSATFQGDITGGAPVSVSMNGSGVETLAGICSYTGSTTINSGTLLISGTLGNTPVTVGSGSTLAGAGLIGSGTGGAVTTSSNGIISPGNSPSTGGVLTIGNGLSLNQATLDFGLTNSPASASNNAILLKGGTLSLTGTQSLQFSYLNTNYTAGTYTLISGGTSTALNGAVLTSNLPAGSRQTYVLQTSAAGSGAAYVRLVVSGSPPASLSWVGTAGGGTWDTQNTTSWSGGPTSTFYSYDNVTFSDNSANGTVNINGTVIPASVLVNDNATAYTLSGTGSISGPAVLTKSGAGSLTISGSNSYTGGTVINTGSVILANSTANGYGLGTGSVTFNGGTLVLAGYTSNSSYGTFSNNLIVPAGSAGTLDVTQNGGGSSPYAVLNGTLTGGGTLNMSVYYNHSGIGGNWSGFTGTLNVTTPATGNFMLSANYGDPGMAGALINLGNNVTMLFPGTVNNPSTQVNIGEIAGSKSSILEGGDVGGRTLIWGVGWDNLNATFSGAISEQGSSDITSLIKYGTGTWTLAGPCNYNGSTLVNAGVLCISWTVNCAGNFQVLSGAGLTLAGGSVTTPNLTINPGATFSGSGTITTTFINSGTLTTGSRSTLAIIGNAVNNGTMSFTGGSALSVSGTFTNNGTLDLLTGSQTLPANLINSGTIINSSSVKVLSTTKSVSSISMNIQSYTGHTYTLQSATSLTTPNWQTVTAQTGNGTVLTFTDPAASGSAKFYRISIAP